MTGLPLPTGPRSREIAERLTETWKQFRESRPFSRRAARLLVAYRLAIETYGEALREDSGLPDPKYNVERVRKAFPY